MKNKESGSVQSGKEVAYERFASHSQGLEESTPRNVQK